VTAFLLLGCAREKEATVFKLEEAGYLSAQSRTVELSVECDIPWKAALEEVSWASLSIGENSVSIALETNFTAEKRSALLTVTAASQTKEVTIEQDEFGSLIRPSVLTITGAQAGSIDVKLEGDWTYSVTGGEDWFSLEKLAVNSKISRLTLTPVDDNQNIGPREGAVQIKWGTESYTVKVSQPQTDAIRADNLLQVSGREGEYRIETLSNVDYTLSIPDEVTWITELASKALNPGTVSLAVEENRTGKERTAVISLKGGSAEQSISVKQLPWNKVFRLEEVGVYGLSGADYPVSSFRQWSWGHTLSDGAFFRMLEPSAKRVLAVGGIPEDVRPGDRFTAKIVLLEGIYTLLEQEIELYTHEARDGVFYFTGPSGESLFLKKAAL